MATPVAERPPKGLDVQFLGVWRHALKTLKAQGTWAWEQKPLLDEYVFALKDADWARRNDEPTRWDRSSKRALALADQLALTPRGRKAIGLKETTDDGKKPTGFAGLDEVAARRGQRQAS